MLATAGNTVKLWNISNYALHQEISSTSGRLIGLTWNQDGQCLASLGSSGEEITLSAINAKSAATIGVVRGVDAPTCIKFANRSPHYLGIGSKDGTVALWNVKLQARKKQFAVTNGALTKISFSHNDNHIAAASKKGAIFLLSVVNNSSTGPFKVFDNVPITDMVYSRAKKSLLGCCSEEGSVSLFDSHARKVIHSFKGAHSAPAACVSFSPVNELLMISVGYDKKFACYNVQTKQPLMTHLSSAPLTSAAFLSGGQQVALGTMTGQVFIHDLRTLRTPLATISAHTKAVSSIILQPATRTVSERTANTAKSSRQKANIEAPALKSDKTSKSCSDEPSGIPPVDISVKKKMDISPGKFDPSDDVLSTDVFSPIRSNENPVMANLDQMMEKFYSVEQYGARESIGMDDVLSPVRPTAKVDNLSPSQTSPKSHNIDDDIFSPVRESAANAGLPKITSGMLEPYKGGSNCEDDLLSPVRYEDYTRHLSPNVPQITLSSSEDPLAEIVIPQSENEKGKENVQPSDAGVQGKGTPVRSSVLEEGSPSSVLSLRNQVNDAKVKSITNSRSKMKQNVSTPEAKLAEQSKTPEFTNPIVKFSHSKTIESPAEKLQSEKISVEDKTTPNRYRYTRSSPPNKRPFICPVQTSELFSPAEGSVGASPMTLDISKQGGGTASVLQVDLIRNCMAEVLEEFQDDVNRRLMHLQCVVTKQFLKQQETMEQLHRQYSLNEDLLQENERLHQEIKHLKATF